MRSSNSQMACRVIDIERLEVCALVGQRLRRAAAVARLRPGSAPQDLRLAARVLEAVEGHLRARERIKAVAQRKRSTNHVLEQTAVT